jgi:hypothetical protein
MLGVFYKYKGYRAEKRPDGTVLVLNKIMTVQEFHNWVDEIYLTIENSIKEARSVNPHQMDCPGKP